MQPNNTNFIPRNVRFHDVVQVQNLPTGGDHKEARLSKDLQDRVILKQGAKRRCAEGSDEQKKVVRTALTSFVKEDPTVIEDTINSLENNLTNPQAKKKYIDLLHKFPKYKPESIFWNPKTQKLEGLQP